MGSLVANENFTHILRVLNTNVDGKQKIMYALTAIRSVHEAAAQGRVALFRTCFTGRGRHDVLYNC
mgnify:CR=1 FL=1